jgi:hypothetical protein
MFASQSLLPTRQLLTCGMATLLHMPQTRSLIVRDSRGSSYRVRRRHACRKACTISPELLVMMWSSPVCTSYARTMWHSSCLCLFQDYCSSRRSETQALTWSSRGRLLKVCRGVPHPAPCEAPGTVPRASSSLGPRVVVLRTAHRRHGSRTTRGRLCGNDPRCSVCGGTHGCALPLA